MSEEVDTLETNVIALLNIIKILKSDISFRSFNLGDERLVFLISIKFEKFSFTPSANRFLFHSAQLRKKKIARIKIGRSGRPLPIRSTPSRPVLTVGAVEILLDWCCWLDKFVFYYYLLIFSKFLFVIIVMSWKWSIIRKIQNFLVFSNLF